MTKTLPKRGLVCIDCGTEYPDVDAMIADDHYTGKPCPEAEPVVLRRSTFCNARSHRACDGFMPGTSRRVQCRCECHA